MKHDVCAAYLTRLHKTVTVEAASPEEAVAKVEAMQRAGELGGSGWEVDGDYSNDHPLEPVYLEPHLEFVRWGEVPSQDVFVSQAEGLIPFRMRLNPIDMMIFEEVAGDWDGDGETVAHERKGDTIVFTDARHLLLLVRRLTSAWQNMEYEDIRHEDPPHREMADRIFDAVGIEVSYYDDGSDELREMR